MTTKPRNGRTIVQALLEELWREMDTVVEHIQSTDGLPYWEAYGQDWDKFANELQRHCEWRGQAQGLAYALAVLTNPYQPDIDAIREEAMQRWEEGEE